MLTMGFSLAVLTTAGFVVIYRKLPERIRRSMERHDLLTDGLAMAGTYVLIGGSVTGLFAAAFVGLLTSALLKAAKDLESRQGMAALVEAVGRGWSFCVRGIVSLLKYVGTETAPQNG